MYVEKETYFKPNSVSAEKTSLKEKNKIRKKYVELRTYIYIYINGDSKSFNNLTIPWKVRSAFVVGPSERPIFRRKKIVSNIYNIVYLHGKSM